VVVFTLFVAGATMRRPASTPYVAEGLNGETRYGGNWSFGALDQSKWEGLPNIDLGDLTLADLDDVPHVETHLKK